MECAELAFQRVHAIFLGRRKKERLLIRCGSRSKALILATLLCAGTKATLCHGWSWWGFKHPSYYIWYTYSSVDGFRLAFGLFAEIFLVLKKSLAVGRPSVATKRFEESREIPAAYVRSHSHAYVSRELETKMWQQWCRRCWDESLLWDIYENCSMHGCKLVAYIGH